MWRVRYGATVEERAENLANGNTPQTVAQGAVPIRSQKYTFDYCHRVGGRQLRGDPVGEAFFDSIRHRYVENFWINDMSRDYVFVRSQRYGESTANMERNLDPMHVVNNNIFRSVYLVRLNRPMTSNNWYPVGCSCEDRFYRKRACKHMLAVSMVRDRGEPRLRRSARLRNRRSRLEFINEFTNILKF